MHGVAVSAVPSQLKEKKAIQDIRLPCENTQPLKHLKDIDSKTV